MKILIVSHNPISTFNNMGKTIGSLFSSFPKEALCQLYLHPSVPDVEACNSYYRITDRAVLMSYFKWRVRGEVIKVDENQHSCSDESEAGRLYRKVKNVSVGKRLARDFLWKHSRWYNGELKAWIEREAPTVMFVAPGMPKLLYEIAFKIASKHQLPIVTYICDDYYFLKKGKNLPERYMNWRVRRKIEQLMIKTNHVVFICDYLRLAYQARFNVKADTIMNGTTREISQSVTSSPTISSLTYMGNLYYDRELSLAEIGRSLERINEGNGTNYLLHVYTGEINEKTRKMFEQISTVRLHGFVSGDELERVIERADAFVHVEGFDEACRDMVKGSVSTKIADSLGNGKVFLAYGPDDVASIQYLKQNQCAFVATSLEALEIQLKKMFSDESERIYQINKALEIAEKNHVTQHNSERLYGIFQSINKGEPT